MTKAQAIKKSIEHWERMIEWVERQIHQKNCFDIWDLKEELGEDWYAKDCPLCNKYYNKGCLSLNHKEACGKCPLYKHAGMACDEGGHIWKRVNSSPSKKEEWLINARKMLKLLKELQ